MSVDDDIRFLEEALRSAMKKATDLRMAIEDPYHPTGPGSLEKEWNALHKSLCVAIRASGPYLV